MSQRSVNIWIPSHDDKLFNIKHATNSDTIQTCSTEMIKNQNLQKPSTTRWGCVAAMEGNLGLLIKTELSPWCCKSGRGNAELPLQAAY